MVFEMHLILQDNAIAGRIRTKYAFVWSKFIKAIPIGISLEGEFALIRGIPLL
jgi:hypothetical protein